MMVNTPAWIEAGPINAKTTLVFLHGIGGGKMGFQSSVDYFATLGYRALAWDMPGYGDSALNGALSFARQSPSAKGGAGGPQHGRHGGTTSLDAMPAAH
ncbi:MAG: Pimeloyl-[acyl-carrier protein] methyl ester esterase [Pseudomonadota bacterium]